MNQADSLAPILIQAALQLAVTSSPADISTCSAAITTATAAAAEPQQFLRKQAETAGLFKAFCERFAVCQASPESRDSAAVFRDAMAGRMFRLVASKLLNKLNYFEI